MEANEIWLDWAVKLQAIAQAGLHYGKDVYDRERYELIRNIAAEMMSYKTDIPIDKIKTLFCDESGYQTPKIDTRAGIIKDGKILLVHEKNGTWALPGGWCDVDVTVGENCVKEVWEEAGLKASITRVVAVQDKDNHNRPVYAHKICKVLVLCEAEDGEFKSNSETTETKYFGPDEIPEDLALEKTSPDQIAIMFEAYGAEHWDTVIE